MLGWLIGRYATRETRRVLAIVREMPITARRKVMAHVSDKMALVGNAEAKGGSAFYLAMRHVAEEATRERQNAVTYGARSFSDPRWCAPALVEQWALAWLAMKQGQVSRARFNEIDAALWDAIKEALELDEILVAGHQSAPKLFLSYRREDAAGDARSIFGVLVQYFGVDNIFFDVSSIAVGERFEPELRRALHECAVFIPIIGFNWLGPLKDRLRIDEQDYVRVEVETALELGVPVIPVLLGRNGRMAPFPGPRELPPRMGELSAFQFHTVAHERFDRDVMDLVTAIRKQVSDRLSEQWKAVPQRHAANTATRVPEEAVTTSIDAMELAMRLHDALDRFIKIDEEIFKPRFWRAIGVTRIPFAEQRQILAEIEHELGVLESAARSRGERKFLIAEMYAERLRTAVRLLGAICAGLELKANGKGGPSWAEHRLMIDAYHEAKNSYGALGSDLNKFSRDAQFSDEADHEGQ